MHAMVVFPGVSDRERPEQEIFPMRRLGPIFRLVRPRGWPYFQRWDTPPQRGAYIWKDTSNGDEYPGSAPGQSALLFWPLCQTPHLDS